jgi:uncharacterized protein (TIGR02271 family)
MDQNKPLSPQENDERSRMQEKIVPVIHEYATVHKEVVETGKVHIRKTIVEENVQVNLPVINESYTVERVPGRGDILDTPPPSVRYEGDVMIIPVIKETTIVQKRYEIIEELRIIRNITETPLVQEVTLRKEQVHIDRTNKSGNHPEA